MSSQTKQFALVRQGAGILLVSGLVGLAFNTLNPAGLSLEQPATASDDTGRAPAGPEGLYRVETLSARLVPSGGPEIAAADDRTSARPSPRVGSTAIPARTTWEKVAPLVERGEVVLVDSRPRLTFEAGHIPGAVNLPEKEVEEAISEFLATYLPPDTRLVIYCGNEKCASSAKLAAILSNDYGYDHVQYVPGGYLEWRRTRNQTPKR